MSDKSTSFELNGEKKFQDNFADFDFSIPLVMGILNATPDSFYDGGQYLNREVLFNRVSSMVNDGVDIIDVGGVSTRPGAAFVSEEEELIRILEPLHLIKKEFPHLPVSIDTFRSSVATACVLEGADMINDISGGTLDDAMFETIARLKIPYVLMHIQGAPETMQQSPIVNRVVEKVHSFFKERVAMLLELGVADVILDPGFGFGKSLGCNFMLLNNMEQLRVHNLPLLAGISRKSMINKVLDTKPEEALNGTSVLHLMALQQGANLLRVHDVKEAKEVIKLFQYSSTARCEDAD
ncbi:MAG: dihydropteroate synthase [Bacteroidetes bacterium]|nr:MAG: dihydropteroate synthase [Bacteroidota bacterium]